LHLLLLLLLLLLRRRRRRRACVRVSKCSEALPNKAV
jgi:hypothetical protein